MKCSFLGIRLIGRSLAVSIALTILYAAFSRANAQSMKLPDSTWRCFIISPYDKDGIFVM
jgi:hypothetical protein